MYTHTKAARYATLTPHPLRVTLPNTVHPCVMHIEPDMVFRKANPLVLGVRYQGWLEVRVS